MRLHAQTEADLAALAASLAASLKSQLTQRASIPPASTTASALVLELIGDVGAGKTTFTRLLAKHLGVTTPVTSPSYTISNRYTFPGGTLIHYDFYRLDDPGIMEFELAEALSSPDTIIIVEWGESVKNLLPNARTVITFQINPDDSRELTIKP